jgi:peptidoglycan/xylan/chitin deacetylase (PgdA/CDA1 family)
MPSLTCYVFRKLLNYLEQQDIKATFFAVGSRIIQYPNIAREEYESGHEISVHTWSHPVSTGFSS